MPYNADRNLVSHPFLYHADASNIEHLQAMAIELAKAIDSVCPESREKSLAFTNLEQTVMWADASVARSGFDRRNAD